MNRTERKCIVASACFHGLLLLVLVFGSGFFPRAKDFPAPTITMIPASAIITDGPTRGGGNPNVTTPPAAGNPAAARPLPPPPAPAPAKAAVREADPEPPRPAVKDNSFKLPDAAKKLKAKTSDTASKSKTKSRELSASELKVQKKGPTKSNAKAASSPANDQRAIREAQRERDALLGSVIAGIVGGTSKGVGVEIPGPGGQAFVNYRDLILDAYKRRFDRELEQVGGSLRPGLTVDVAITIRRDGTVTGRAVTRGSGVRLLDEAVRRVINGVHNIAPFPAEATDALRTFNVTFEPRVDRLAG